MAEINCERYRVELRSAPGFWERYDGYVDVWASDDDEAVQRALNRLKRETFPDRPRSAWILVSVTKKTV